MFLALQVQLIRNLIQAEHLKALVLLTRITTFIVLICRVEILIHKSYIELKMFFRGRFHFYSILDTLYILFYILLNENVSDFFFSWLKTFIFLKTLMNIDTSCVIYKKEY